MTITFPASVVVTSADINRVKSIVIQWCRNYYKKIQIQKHAKQLNDLASIPSPDEIKKLDSSDHVMK